MNQGNYGYNPTNSTNPGLNQDHVNQAMNQAAMYGMNQAMNQGGMGGMGGMGINTNAFNSAVNTDVANMASKMAGITNPYNVTLPTCGYNSGCKKCSGTGRVSKKGAIYPCKRCYKKGGFCTVCLGSKINYITGQQCHACQNGSYNKGHKKEHGHGHGKKGGKGKGHGSGSDSSDSDW